MARLTREDWLAEGYKVLEAFAQNRLRIAYLCERLKVTRGSFYHHFKSIDDYKMALLSDWEKQQTLNVIDGANEEGSPEEQMEKLTQLIANSNHKVEAAIRSWGFYDSNIRRFLQEVDTKRLQYLETVYTAMGVSQDIISRLAKLDYATLIGIQQMYPDIQMEELAKLWEVQRHMLRSNL